MNFAEFKKKKSSLLDAIKSMKDDKPDYKDKRFWTIKKDDAGNGIALIRFLPQKDAEKLPFVKVMNHGFQQNGRWFIENCPSTIGEPCPICEYALPVFDTLQEGQSNPYYKKVQFIANLLVVKEDPDNPETQGKVWLFSFGKKIYEKVIAKTAPESEIEEAVNVFDLWEGMNFKLKVTKQKGWPNYDTSEFESKQSPVSKKESTIESIYNSIFDLEEFVAPARFKSYDELQEKLNTFLKAKRTITNVEDESRSSESTSGKSSGKASKSKGEDEGNGTTDYDSLIGKEDKKKTTPKKTDKPKSKPEPEPEEDEDSDKEEDETEEEENSSDAEKESLPWETD